MKYLFIILYLFTLVTSCFSQTINVKGHIIYRETDISDALIIIEGAQDRVRTISNQEGRFASAISSKEDDSISITVQKEGYSSITKKYHSTELNAGETVIEFSEQVYALSEVTVSGQKDVIQKANKTIYKFNPKDFLKHSSLQDGLKRLPQLYVTTDGIKLNNTRDVLIFIDNIEASVEELKHLDIADVEKVEVIDTPSASYGSEFTGGIIKVTLKEKNENFIKGDIEYSQGIRLKQSYILPTLTIKNKYMQASAFYYYTTNNQNPELEEERTYTGQKAESQKLERHIKGWQELLTANLKLYLGEKAWLLVKGSNSRYKFHTNANGYVNQINTNYKQLEEMSTTTIGTLFRYNFSTKNDLQWKGNYLEYRTKDASSYTDETTIISKIKEYSTELVYEHNNIDFLKGLLNTSAGYKFIHRLFSYTGSYMPRQNIQSIYLDANYTFNSFSAFLSLPIEYTHNWGINAKQDYTYFLPALSLMYKLTNEQSLSASYSKRIIRPGSEYLNPSLISINPFYSRRGMPSLSPQALHSLRLAYNIKVGKSTSLFANTEYLHYKNCISEILSEENEKLIYTYSNLGKSKIAGANIGAALNIADVVYINTNCGYRYHTLSSGSDRAIVQGNHGSSFNSSLNISGMITSNIQVYADFSYASRLYTMNATLRNQPRLNVGTQANFLKDKLTLGIYYSDAFNLNATTKSYIKTKVYTNSSILTNRLSNLTFTATFRFGKSFNADMHDSGIINSDLQLKQ